MRFFHDEPVGISTNFTAQNLMSSGIYEILNTASGKRYIGQSVDIQRRWKEHRKTLRRGISHQPHLQSAWNKYGESAFQFSILGLCAPRDLTYFEQAWMDTRKPEYNKAPAAGSPFGIKRSAETRERVAAANRGKKQSEDTRQKRALAMRGNTNTLGHKLSDAHKAKIRETIIASPRARKQRLTLVVGLRGKPLPEEHRLKIARAQIGNTNSLGHRHTPETRLKMSILARDREARKRAAKANGL